ncbi:unnamed protein product [Allacma fusca]|uniref:Regulator of telomere elongation helicase 1 homolog n=1 Tax=Allacma fusca TaxID=39272 RepID=A0A8J2JAH8_9HEXA|nr:unnamed protein product [Allacma fusca]
MPVFKIDDLDIHFPFEPYDVQKDLMSKVVECLRMRQNGLLESPTGTGKTLSLLCASIAWQRKQKSFVNTLKHNMRQETGDKNAHVSAAFSIPKIIYSSRTHSQLSQAIQELKRSHYKDSRAIVLGSRDLMCVHEEVSRLESSQAKIMACHIRVHAHTCGYYNAINSKKEDPLIREMAVMDIEDLVKKGKTHRFCPFYMSREFVQDAEVVFMPYNYLLDPKLRSSHGIDLKNCVIILDEGHNIAQICEESVSFEIKSSTIAHCIQELTKAMNEFSETTNELGNSAVTKDISLGMLINLKKSFLELETELDAIQTTSEGILLPGQQLLQIIFQHGFPPMSLIRTVDELDKISTFLSGSNFETLGCDKFSSVLRVLASQSMFREPAKFAESYKVFVQYEETKRAKSDIRSYDSRSNKSAKVFNFWCFNPAVGLETMMLNGPRCVLLASGTLSPMSFLAKELQVPFLVQHTNPHIIKDNQLFASVVTCGPENVRLSSSYQNRTDKNYMRSLGDLIRLVCSVVPKGVLVFFPSYSVMDLCKREWEQTGMWGMMEQTKKLMMEPRGKDAFKKTMDDYYSAVKTSTGACLMAVCRGKVSEGLDFTDDNGRAVIITGIPYSPAKDPHVLAKQQYLNNKQSNGDRDCISGSSWYQLEATRALNQAIGRIIRHAHDYGAILICDERCASKGFQINLSAWVQQRIKNSSNFDNTLRELGEFFGSSVQKERAELSKSLLMKGRKSLKAKKSSVDQSVIRQVLADTTTEQELEDLYADEKCTVEYSSGRNPTQTQGQSQSRETVKANIKQIADLGDLSNAPTLAKVANFNSSVPVYPKSFAAFSKSPASSKTPMENQKKKIKLASRNFSYGGGTVSKAIPETPGAYSTLSASGTDFNDFKEFWNWVKIAIPHGHGAFVKSLRIFKSDRNTSKLASKIMEVFPRELLDKCFAGLSLGVVNRSELTIIKDTILNQSTH